MFLRLCNARCFSLGASSTAKGLLLPLNGSVWSLGLGAMMVAVGQGLNVAVFYRLGKVGVFYGNKLGYSIPWSRKFPFSCLKHPQYVGALLSIWGFFLVMRFPHNDWYMLPALETVYYTVGGALRALMCRFLLCFSGLRIWTRVLRTDFANEADAPAGLCYQTVTNL